jgi:Mlc titration factor MtfA (ptsG expression regulator)
MIKWPWKSNESARSTAFPWEEALAIPVLAYLSDEEKHRLAQLAERFLQQKRQVPLQGFELDEQKSARIALLFC